jgi:beta-phosphoglucomutase family hydrolase
MEDMRMDKTAMELNIDPGAKALIFDIDGTLADTMPLHFKAWQAIGQRYNFVYPQELFYELAGIPTTKLIPILNERLGCSLDPEQTIQEKEEIFLEMLPETKPIQPVVNLVYEHHGKIPMSLGTGGKREIATLTIKAIQLEKYFDILVGAEDVVNHKPSPDTFLKCAELMKVKPEACEVFEDGIQGLTAARAAGMIATDVRPFL